MTGATPAWTLLPFVGLLLVIAIAPLLPRLHHHWEKRPVQLAVALLFGVPMALWLLARGEGHAVLHALEEYLQFIILLGSLYVISGGIRLEGDLEATPGVNTLFLAIGALLASFVGTTGAAMLLIRPLLDTNEERTQKTHTVVFLIFLVANCGGLLTPLGDPPLFLGMLRGVPFLWTFRLVLPWLFVNGMLLVSYYLLDTRLHAREPIRALVRDHEVRRPLQLRGGGQLALLAGVVAAVAFVPAPWREGILLLLSGLSYFLGSREIRFERNRFQFDPILEVGALFLGIFLAMAPALQFLGENAHRLPLHETTLFLFTGGLSAFLDNAPTYATFFEMAQRLPGEPRIAGVFEPHLVAISLGAVFCGAITYIGNGPNFMIKAVAESRGVAMPSFGAYLLRWSLIYLVPILGITCCLFVAPPPWARIAGGVGAGLLVLLWYGLSRSRRQRGHGPLDSL